MAPKTAINKGKGKKVVGPSDDPAALSAFSGKRSERKIYASTQINPVYFRLSYASICLIPQHGAFGADSTQTMEYDFHYSSLEGIPMFGDREQEELGLLSEPSISTFRCLITDAPLESINCDHIVKHVSYLETLQRIQSYWNWALIDGLGL
ncbi:uncharacterized protein A4U43_C04F31790 [Asparagus officinalis]|uniref:Uncharacterized protein n=1 Tax=Asparagus officinalis TaxID=4686 RepID=A0A5P1F5T0_ASPOF|nr:uncharacterized protein A4U43_C04F31790 [Asparagus officinalis]